MENPGFILPQTAQIETVFHPAMARSSQEGFMAKDHPYASITADADGTFTDERIDFSFGVETDFGSMEITINQKQIGTYTIDGGTMSTVIPGGQEAAVVTMSIDGVPFNPPGGIIPIEPPEASLDAVAPDCGDDTMMVTAEGITSVWNRVS